MKTIIHVNQHNIRRNLKTDSNDPVLTCKTYKDNRYGHTAIIKDNDGNECGMLRSYGTFNFLQIYNAGHMVPRDQPTWYVYLYNCTFLIMIICN